MECPACHYVRQPEDDAPDWQCPSCERAYGKVQPAAVARPSRRRSGGSGAAAGGTSRENAALLAQGLALVGACLLIAGAFAPFVSMPLVGGVTLFQNGEGDGVFIVGFAVVGIIAAALKWLWVTAGAGLLSGAIVAYDMLQVRGALNEEVQQIRDSDFGGLIDQNAVADMASGMVSFQWGVALIVIGVVLTIVAPFLSRLR